MGRSDLSICWSAHKAQFRHVRVSYRVYLDPYHLLASTRGRVIGRAHLLSDGSHVQVAGGTLHLDRATSASESFLRH